MAQSRKILIIRHSSDGTGAKPPPERDLDSQNDWWCHEIGKRWAKDLGLEAPYEQYSLDRLPEGYSGFSKPRKHRRKKDYYLYGHPKTSKVDSVNKFYCHFRCLMDYGGVENCACIMCDK
ncbi:hypothetical protein K470DRAFT_255879 [Piedraia hortae CBS 480.64]|uniref:Cryptic loci regulator 2 N-terminal domain-containing protein n=1 Tax=Piedraia hortae CBS 480.64 TaxID=1314780 RepID=A0A6A7C5R8_9PEZI|nr:hypothetical protein K470DRAFT_255879 [Piedraia hortae CBS 480.64]